MNKRNKIYSLIFVALVTVFMLFSPTSAQAGQQLYISVDHDIALELNPDAAISFSGIHGDIGLAQIDEDMIMEIVEIAHKKNRCGGFFVHESVEDAIASVSQFHKVKPRTYTLNKLPIIPSLIGNVKEPEIKSFIEKLSSFHNRYYSSETGVKAAKYIKETWSKYAPTVLYEHKNWAQPSVIATITGSKYPNEVIVIGGHLDSISGWFGGAGKRAPGADDNASGTATVTEVLRVLSQSGYKPLRTIKFMGYAAEEVGLRGSSQIAKDFKAKGVNVIGAMQLDMTNFKGSDKTIYLTTDYTNESQTQFLGKLIDEYVKVPYGTTRCGYACSDHASWDRAGYPAVFPFEAGKGDMNGKIHTTKDIISVSGGTALHAVNFAKLGLAYLVEMDQQKINP